MSELLQEQILIPDDRQLDYIVDFPYDKISLEDASIITSDVTSRSDELIDSIVNSDEQTFESILAPINEIDDLLSLAVQKINLTSDVHEDETVRKDATEKIKQISDYASGIYFNEELYNSVKAYSETDNAKELVGEEARALKSALLAFRHSGQGLELEKRERIQLLKIGISKDSTEYGFNINNDKTTVEFTEEDLKGASDRFKNGLGKSEESGNYLITMKAPDIMPIYQSATNRETRKKVSTVYGSQCVEENRPLLEETIAKRQEIASLLGYESWAHYKLEDRMAKSPDAVFDFYDELIEPLLEKGREEIAVMTEMLEADGFEGPLQKYDVTYYQTRLKERDYGINPEKVAEYFPLNSVLEGLFDVTGSTFGLKFREIDIPTWHPDVKAFAIDDAETGEEISTFYMDLFPREGKYDHFCATTLVKGREMPDGTYRKPSSAILANFTKPTEDEPSLLQHSDVTTMFHEFGHVLHQTLTKAKLIEFSGSSVERDFVEAMSQIMEHWTFEPTVLQKFAKHYKTGEPIPEEMVNSLVAAKNLNIALFTLNQIRYSKFDMAIHDATPNKDLNKILEDLDKTSLTPPLEGTFFPANFGHIMGGYDAGYYGYHWAEVYGDDMYSRFEEEGLNSPIVGLDYRRKILERGSTVDGIVMLREFLGREPNNKAFLRNLGITAVSKA